MELICLARVLVVDRINGPADILSDVLGCVFAPQVTITRANNTDLSGALASCAFNLIAVGLDSASPSMLPTLRSVALSTPIMVVGYQLRYAELERCHNFAIHTTIEMPRRAAELKSAIVTIARQYFRCV